MPSYGITADGWTALPWSWASDRIIPNRNYWIVTTSGGGRPHALPVWGVWDDGDMRFCFSSAPDSRKARNVAENSSVVVTIDDTIECVSIEGTGERITDTTRADTWIERYLAKYRSEAPGLNADFLRQNLLFEITPDRAFGLIERDDEFATRATKWVFS